MKTIISLVVLGSVVIGILLMAVVAIGAVERMVDNYKSKVRQIERGFTDLETNPSSRPLSYR